MRLVESILCQNGIYINVDLHQARMNRAFHTYNSMIQPHDLRNILPTLDMEGSYKVRIVYDMDQEDAAYTIEYVEYAPKEISSLEVVHSDPFDYSMKYENRKVINKLVDSTSADDIIIAINDNVTDGSYFNLAFWDEKQWLTSNTPLLNGVRRTQLINEGRIKETNITVNNLSTFEKVSLINAMLDLGELEVLMKHVLIS